MRFWSPGVAIVPGRRIVRFRLDVFLVRMWLRPALPRFTLPLAVSLKRFFAPLCVFIFIGRFASLGRQDQGHVLAFELRVRLDLRNVREVGADPSSGKPLVVKDGRFGPYVTDGETNASLRRGDDVESLTIDRAVELLAERRAAGPSKRPKKRSRS